MLPADLRKQRLRLHLSQAALAEALGVARNTVARWERNELEIRHPELIQMGMKHFLEGARQVQVGRSHGRGSKPLAVARCARLP